MFLISSAITKEFHGDHATHARYMKLGGVEDDLGGCVLHLSQQEQHTLIDALMEQRERQENALTSSPQAPYPSLPPYGESSLILLRLLSPQSQRAALRGPHRSPAKRVRWGKEEQGSGRSFRRKAETELSGLCDDAGRRMTRCLLDDVERFPEEVYRAAFQKAIDINDPEKAALLQEQAVSHVKDLTPSFFGEMASYAYLDHRFIAKQIVDQSSNEQVAAAPTYLLEQSAMKPDYQFMSALVKKGFNAGSGAASVLRQLTQNNRNSWMAETLLQERMWVDPRDYKAFHICVQNDAVGTAKLLLDGGVDFEGYRQWAQARCYGGRKETLQALSEHWSELTAAVEENALENEAPAEVPPNQAEGPEQGGPAIGGMTFG